ncbi:hypothetical protein SCYAM73S_03731 [Streptomyces cyaneofuscatus]
MFPPRWKTVFGALEEAAAQAPGTKIHLYDADGLYDVTTYGALYEDDITLFLVAGPPEQTGLARRP